MLSVETPTGSYDIVLSDGALARTGKLLREYDAGRNVAVVTDTNVAELYLATVQDSLDAVGYTHTAFSFPAGEKYKTLDTVRQLYDDFTAARLDRQTVVLALGGGVVGDVAGFAAATYLRGMPLVQCPTTLLAMVDSSVGGKTGVDLPQGKNLVGAFKQPELVITDPTTLRTLAEDELRAGLAELIKHGVIAAPHILTRLEQDGTAAIANLLADAIQVKIAVVEEDPFERGRRAVLNLGHTFGHALEVLTNYQMRHGEAVAVGMVIAAQVAERLGAAQAGLAARISALLRKVGLPISYHGFSPERIWDAMATDKKRRGKQLRFVLPRAVGDVVITDDVPRAVVLVVLGGLQASRD